MIAVFAAKDLGRKKAASSRRVERRPGLVFHQVSRNTARDQADEGHRGEDDFRAQLTVIKNTSLDVLVIPTMGKCLPRGEAGPELGLNVEIIGGDGYGDFMREIADAIATYWVTRTRQTRAGRFLRARRPPARSAWSS
ncbi:hypothetical protein MASR2M79_02540 [Aminivibrio sp.]